MISLVINLSRQVLWHWYNFPSVLHNGFEYFLKEYSYFYPHSFSRDISSHYWYVWMFRRFLVKMQVSIQIRMLLHKGIHYLHKQVHSISLWTEKFVYEFKKIIQNIDAYDEFYSINIFQFDNSFSECQERREFEFGTPIVKRSSQFETIFYERACQPSGKFAWRGRFALEVPPS